MAAAEHKLHCRWYLDLRSGETRPFALKPGHRAWVTHAELVGPASAAAGQSVRVALRDRTGDGRIGLVLSAERPVAPVLSMVVLEDAFCLERDDDDSADAVVRFVGGCVDVFATPETEAVEEGEDQEAVLEEDDDGKAVGSEDDEDEVTVLEESDDSDGVSDEKMEEDACWYVDLRSGETKPFALKPGQRAWVSHAELVRPSSAAAGQTVRVALRTKTGDVQSLVLSANRNVVMVRSTVMLDEEFWLEREADDSTDAVVRFVVCDGNVHAIPETQTVEEGEDREAALEEEEDGDGEAVGSEDDEDVEMVEGTVYEVTVPEESDDSDGISDDDEEDEEESDGEFDVSVADEALLLQMVHPRRFVPEARFLGGSAPQFAAAGRTAGFMRVQDADAEDQEGGGDRPQILVLYRYTRFSAAWSDGSVEARGSTREHQLRFIAAAGHGARSLAWAGASLAPLIYPGGSSNRLRELWSSLASQVSLPPGAARVKVFVDVGILRQADCTQASMEHMRDALEEMMAQPWPARFIGMELSLPEPVQCDHDEDKAAHGKGTDGEQRPAKRRRVVAAGEDCGVCLELLEGDDLAAWPGCGKTHVFHGRCLELVLEKTEACPICRHRLRIEPKF